MFLLFEWVDNFKDMVQVFVDEIWEIICFCGFFFCKLVAISELLNILVEKYGGVVFEEMEVLEVLFGVGYKMAFVVMFQVFGEFVFLVDIYIYCLVYCWGLSIGKNVQCMEYDFK